VLEEAELEGTRFKSLERTLDCHSECALTMDLYTFDGWDAYILLSPPSPRALEDGKLRCSSMYAILDSIQAEHFTMLDIKGFKKQKCMSEV